MIVANTEEEFDKSSNNNIKYLLCFCIFFILGGVLGIIMTTKYLELQDEDGNNLTMNETENSIDITGDKEYEATISSLKSIISASPVFYNSNGFKSAEMNKDDMLSYIYKYLISAEKFTDSTLANTYWGSSYCENDFLVSYESTDDGSSYSLGICELKNMSINDINAAAKSLFGVDNVDVSGDFMATDNTKCIIQGENYVCGLVNPVTGITGELTPKFDTLKVTKEEDGSLIIYEKGYLVDTRSNVVNPDDGYDNYYLHSSDSSAYYFELKSADNLTFKHTFKMNSDRSYYLFSSEVVK